MLGIETSYYITNESARVDQPDLEDTSSESE